MHGDDVASAGVSITTEVLSKTSEAILELIKVGIEKERYVKRSSGNQSKGLSGGEVTLRRLKEGGEITTLPNFPNEDYGEFLKRAKKADIPVAAIQEQGKENSLTLCINEKDKPAVNAIIKDIIQEKLRQPEQTERMITIEKDHVEAFRTACAAQDIPVSFLQTKDGVKCIFHTAYEKQLQAAVADFRKMQEELSKVSVTMETDKHGKPKFVIEDTEQGKRLTVNYCTKAKLERVLQERLGYSEAKAVQAANSLTAQLTDQQKGYYLSSSRTLEQMDYFETHIRLENESLLTEPFSFARMKLANEDTPRLTLTSGSGNFVVLSGHSLNREEAERSIRQYLKVEDAEVVTAILNKAEKLGFVEAPKQVQYKEYQVERDSQSTFTVRGGSTEVRLSLDDKLTARKQLMDSFGMTAAKADRIIAKAQKQSLARNLLDQAKRKVQNAGNTLKNKKRERGARK